MDDFTKKQNIRNHEGAIGIFTNGFVNRVDMFSHVTKLLYGQYQYRLNRK
jgi:inosine/xanthosine triphosphatase